MVQHTTASAIKTDQSMCFPTYASSALAGKEKKLYFLHLLINGDVEKPLDLRSMEVHRLKRISLSQHSGSPSFILL